MSDELYQLSKKAGGSYYFSSVGVTINPGDKFPMSWALASDKLMSHLIGLKLVAPYIEPVVKVLEFKKPVEPMPEDKKEVVDSFGDFKPSKKNKDK